MSEKLQVCPQPRFFVTACFHQDPGRGEGAASSSFLLFLPKVGRSGDVGVLHLTAIFPLPFPAKLTICQPFRLRSTSSSQELFNSEEKGTQEDPFYHLWGLQWRAQSCPDFIPPGIRPVMHTKTTDKRQEANRYIRVAPWTQPLKNPNCYLFPFSSFS